ncbi:putative signal peptide-containing protein [Cryptosporidium canis]|uniref:Signal peptide-containing protein n=1 Tax=Cryptosporidium canis TaxID=195482 RepID=A0ABQ8P4F0_9CRYT|nr:putative signal peptide-containing protein [Cryptosporidium canis]
MISFGRLRARVQFATLLLLIMQGFGNKRLVKVDRFATEQNLMKLSQQGVLESGAREFISEESVGSLAEVIKGRQKSRWSEVIIGDIRVRIFNRKSIGAPRLVLDVEFGNPLNPLYYKSISSSDRCILLLGRHFRIHLRRVFERYLSRATYLSSESHTYFGGSRYFLGLSSSGIGELEVVLGYIAAFFSRGILGSRNAVGDYLLDLQENGNRYFMPENYMRNIFLTVLNDRFRGEEQGREGFRDLYGDLRMCASLGDWRSLTREYGHYFKRKIKRLDVYLSEERVSVQRLERVLRNSLRRVQRYRPGFDHLRYLTKTNPFSELAGGILQVSSSRVRNRLTLMFPMTGQLKKRLPEVSHFMDRILANNERIDGLLKRQEWISGFSHEFEFNSENMYTNLLLSFFSRRPLNSGQELPDFNPVDVVEVWLQLLSDSHSPQDPGHENRSGAVLGPTEPDSEFGNELARHLGIKHMVIVIYSDKPISIRGVDMLELSVKTREDRYWHLMRRWSSISYLIRRDLLPILGIKYLPQREDYYFSTKYVYDNIPPSLISYLSDSYPESGL